MGYKKKQYKKSIDQLTVANLVQFLLWLPNEERAGIVDQVHEILNRQWREVREETIIVGAEL